jgi:Bacterial PH domain
MATVGQTTLSTLFSPLDITSVLVGDENVYYEERQHWAAMAQPIYQTFLFLVFVIWIVGIGGNGNPSSPFQNVLLVILIGAGIHAVIMAINGRNPVSHLAIDPFSSARKGPSRVGRFAFLAALGYLTLSAGVQVGGMVAVILVIARLISVLVRWEFYERRYITSKRLIESGGFFGSRINSMPLTRVTDFSFNRTLPGELLGYASMRIETAGQDQALGTVRYITDPRHFYDVLVALSVPPAPGVPPPAFND